MCSYSNATPKAHNNKDNNKTNKTNNKEDNDQTTNHNNTTNHKSARACRGASKTIRISWKAEYPPR